MYISHSDHGRTNLLRLRRVRQLKCKHGGGANKNVGFHLWLQKALEILLRFLLFFRVLKQEIPFIIRVLEQAVSFILRSCVRTWNPIYLARGHLKLMCV